MWMWGCAVSCVGLRCFLFLFRRVWNLLVILVRFLNCSPRALIIFPLRTKEIYKQEESLFNLFAVGNAEHTCYGIQYTIKHPRDNSMLFVFPSSFQYRSSNTKSNTKRQCFTMYALFHSRTKNDQKQSRDISLGQENTEPFRKVTFDSHFSQRWLSLMLWWLFRWGEYLMTDFDTK